MTLKVDGTNGVLQAYDYQVLTTGFTYTFAAGTQTLIANPAGTLATGTITMPASPVDGMVITFSTTQQITALTLNGNTGQTVTSGPTFMGAGSSASYVYNLANTAWRPIASVPQLITSAGLATEVQPIGVGQTWTSVTGSRSEGVTYTNTTGRTIIAYLSAAQTNTTGISGVVNGITVHSTTTNITGTMRIPVVLTIPPGGTYSATWYSIQSWIELR
jgi:hypothetical protein